MEMSDITCIRKGVASKYHRRLEICKEENSQNRASKKLTMGFSASSSSRFSSCLWFLTCDNGFIRNN